MLEGHESLLEACFWLNIFIFVIFTASSLFAIFNWSLQKEHTSLVACAVLYEVLFGIRVIDCSFKMLRPDTFPEKLFEYFDEFMTIFIWLICMVLVYEMMRVKLVLEC